MIVNQVQVATEALQLLFQSHAAFPNEFHAAVCLIWQLVENRLVEDEQFWRIITQGKSVVFQSLNRLYIYDETTEKIKVISANASITKVFTVGQEVFFQPELAADGSEWLWLAVPTGGRSMGVGFAISRMQADGLAHLIDAALQAAQQRSVELGDNLDTPTD